MSVGDRDHHDLHRCQPQREGAREVLDDDAREALEAAVDRVVNHHRPLEMPLAGAVLEVKALGQLVVELDGRQLPFTPEGILDEDVDLGRIKGRAARVELVGELLRIQGLAELSFGHVPELVRAELLLRSRGEPEARFEAEWRVLLLHEVQRQAKLVEHLVLPAEHVAVVLG